MHTSIIMITNNENKKIKCRSHSYDEKNTTIQTMALYPINRGGGRGGGDREGGIHVQFDVLLSSTEKNDTL